MRRSPDIDTVADVRMIELIVVNAVLDFSRINTAWADVDKEEEEEEEEEELDLAVTWCRTVRSGWRNSQLWAFDEEEDEEEDEGIEEIATAVGVCWCWWLRTTSPPELSATSSITSGIDSNASAMTLADVNASIDESVQYMNGVDEREAPALMRVLLLLLLLLIPIAPADTLADTVYGDGERKRR